MVFGFRNKLSSVRQSNTTVEPPIGAYVYTNKGENVAQLGRQDTNNEVDFAHHSLWPGILHSFVSPRGIRDGENTNHNAMLNAVLSDAGARNSRRLKITFA